jgi:hypothetical protein
MIKRLLILVMALLLVPAATAFAQDSKPKTTKKSHRKHHVKRKTHTGAKKEYAEGGKDMGHGGKKLATNVKHGRVVEGGKELGKGVGRGAKHIAKGTAKTTKKAVDPNASKKKP